MKDTPLRRARLANDWTLGYVAERSGIDISQLSRIERGYGTSPETAEKLASLFQGKVTELEILYPNRRSQSRRQASV